MQIRLVINKVENASELNLASSISVSSWLIDHYFTKIYSEQLKSSNKSIQPHNVIGLHDMFIICQIIQSTIAPNDLVQLCQLKLRKTTDHSLLDNYTQYLNRCGLTDFIDLWHHYQSEKSINTIIFTLNQIQNSMDQLLIEHLLEITSECFIDGQSSIENKEKIQKLIERENKVIEQSISKNYIKHTLCTYLSLLLDTRNEHALIHCLVTPARAGIERRTLVELRRLSQLSKNECLTIYQILLSFIRRKELILSRATSSQPESNKIEDQSFVTLDKYYVGIKEFFDFIEQLQMKIEENEHSKIDSTVTFRQLLSLITKQLRKDHSFNRCESIIKDVIEEFSVCFQGTLPLMECSSPVRSASLGGTLAGRRFLRSVAFLCAKQTIELPILMIRNDHYDSPSTGLRKATASRLIRSPLTPVPVVETEKIVVEEKPQETPVESVFVWQKKTEISSVSTIKPGRYRRRKSHRCLDLSTIDENSSESNDLNEKILSQSSTTSSQTRKALAEIETNSLSNENSVAFSLPSDNDQENAATKTKKRSTPSVQVEPARKKQKKINPKPLISGQKSITSFFQSKN